MTTSNGRTHGRLFLWLVGGEELSWLAGWLDKGHSRGSIVTSRPIDETAMAVSRKIDLLAESPACFGTDLLRSSSYPRALFAPFAVMSAGTFRGSMRLS